MRTSWMRLCVAASLGLLVLAACGADDSGGGTTRSASVREYVVHVVPPAGKAGKNTFEVRNIGKIPHEFVVFRTDLAPNALPVNAEQNTVEETGAGVKLVDEINEIDPGKTKNLTVD